MTQPDGDYENMRRVVYGDSGAQFVPVCETCGRFVKADESIGLCQWDETLSPEPNATCSRCGYEVSDPAIIVVLVLQSIGMFLLGYWAGGKQR